MTRSSSYRPYDYYGGTMRDSGSTERHLVPLPRDYDDDPSPGNWLRHNKLIVLFAVLLIFLYFRGLGDHGLIDPIEGVNASVSLSAYLDGDALHPHTGDFRYAGRTPGLWWLNMISMVVFGWTEYAVRFWSALAGLGIIAASALAVRSRRAAWISAAASASMLICFSVSQTASPHALYAFLTGIAMTAFIHAQEGRSWIIIAHIAPAAAFTVRGPEGLLLPWLTLIMFSYITGRTRTLRTCLTSVPGVLLSVLCTAGYIALLWSRNPMMLRLMLYEAPQLLPSSPGLALLFLTASFMPWSGFMLNAAADALTDGMKNPADTRPFMLMWAGMFCLFALVTGDLPGLAACVTPLAALVGTRLDRLAEESRSAEMRRASALNIFVTLISLLVGLPLSAGSYPVISGAMMSLLPWAGLVLLFTFSVWYYAKTRQPVKLVRNSCAAALLCLLPMAGVFSLAAAQTSVRGASLAVSEIIEEEDVIVQYGMNNPSVYFYTMHGSVIADGPAIDGAVGQNTMSGDDISSLWLNPSVRAFMLIRKDHPMPNGMPSNISVVSEADGVSALCSRMLKRNAQQR